MEFPSKLLENLVYNISQLSGIGKRSALRIALEILRKPKEYSRDLSESIFDFKTQIKYCSECHNISDKDIDKIQVDNKLKPSQANAKKSEKLVNKRVEKSAEVDSIQKDRPNTVSPKEFKSDIVKETEVNEKFKSAKDWGRASNDPRNKS